MDAANTSPRSLEISVCIPVRNEETSISALIDGLLAQTQPPAEIVICDNGSTDATKDIVEGFVKDGAPVKLIREDAGLPGRGRNVAVANSRCQWIAFIDAGVMPETVWLEQLAPFNPDPNHYHHNRTGEDNADAHLKRQIMGREVVVAITKGQLDFGPWEQIFYGEFDGFRSKRVLVKVIGE